jgi:hypothetical protein
MSDRVFLVLSGASAEFLEQVVNSRIVTIEDTECNNPEVRQRLGLERAHLVNVVRMLKEPT